MAKFVPRERKHRRIAKQKIKTRNLEDDANVEVILPRSASQQEVRRQALRQELRAQQDGGNETLSGKKRKRLDKYIDIKLKKEENLELLKKLAASKVDTSLLQSSKKLGRVRESKKELFQRALKERDAGIDVTGDQSSILFEIRQDAPAPSVEEGRSSRASDTSNVAAPPREDAANTQNTSTLGTFGSGLKRPLETDASGQPIIKKRKRRKQLVTKDQVPDLAMIRAESDDEGASTSNESHSSINSDDEWSGFDSDDNLSRPESSVNPDVSPSSSYLTDESGDASDERSSRVSAFKSWADTQMNRVIEFTPSTAHTLDQTAKARFQPRPASPDPETTVELQALLLASQQANRPSCAITIARDEDVQSARLELPVVQEEQKIMEAVNNNPVVVVCGATGSGKTTQVPQMLLENGYAARGMIGITQPRRVAATSVAARVSRELGEEWGKRVAHQVRYDSNVGRDTAIKFMTDGILLREISEDFALSKYSAIVIDEAHERSVNTDVLIGMLSRIVPLRRELSDEQSAQYTPLKLIIMSASLRVSDFVLNNRLFQGTKPPIVEAEGRQYPVTIHFTRRTQRDFVTETVTKVLKGHKKLPSGGILVFLTGQDDIHSVAKRLKQSLSYVSIDLQTSRTEARSSQSRKRHDYLEEEHEADWDSDAEINIYDGDSDSGDDEFVIEEDCDKKTPKRPLKPHVLPLYAALPSDQQMHVFDPVPEDCRLIVLSTNVAETSLTIPGIRYVFDCGRSKEKRYDEATGVQEFTIDWISKASALQRSGRAGRTGPGHCYRLYSSAIYEQYFEDHTAPEILRTPIEATVLQLKGMHVDNVVNFPFPTPPKADQLSKAESLLRNLGAIDSALGKVSDLGKELIRYPVNPRFGKMLSLGLRNNLLDHTIAMVAGLAVGELFIAEPHLITSATSPDVTNADRVDSEVEGQVFHRVDVEASAAALSQRQAYGRAHAKLSSQDDQSDVVRLLTAVAAHAQAETDGEPERFCAQYFLREKGMAEVQQLRRQLHNITHEQGKGRFAPILRLATTREVKLLKQIVVAGFIDQVAIRADLLPSHEPPGRSPRRAIEVPYRTLMPSHLDTCGTGADDRERQKNVYVHAGSLLARLSVNEMPSYVVYSHLSRAAATVTGTDHRAKVRMHPLTTAGPKQLAALAEGTPLLEIAKPIGKIEEIAPRKRECWVGVGLKDPTVAGSMAWPLGAWKVIQTRSKKDWEIERIISR